MRISRIGLTPVKGARHQDLPSVDLTLDGPVGDRVFCLVDPARARVLRTVENPSLLRTSARWYGGVLTVQLPGGTVQDVPAPTGRTLEVDYWGRVAALDVVAGPWAAAYSAHLGTEVVLARSTRPGDVVYGASVTLVTTSSLAALADHVAGPVEAAHFRSTFTVDVGNAPAHVEDDWVGGTVRVGEATLTVRGVVPRCAVVDLDPASGDRRTPVLKALGGYRQHAREVVFGVDAVVTKPGRVDVDAHAERV